MVNNNQTTVYYSFASQPVLISTVYVNFILLNVSNDERYETWLIITIKQMLTQLKLVNVLPV